MTTQELLIQEISTTPEPILTEVYQYLRYLKTEGSADRFDGLTASHSALSKDWDTPEEDAAWANLIVYFGTVFAPLCRHASFLPN